MDRFTERTAREEAVTDLDKPYDCWECGEACAELTQAPWTARRMLVGTCCLPVVEQPENAVTPEEAAALDAEALAIFGKPAASERGNAARKEVA